MCNKGFPNQKGLCVKEGIRFLQERILPWKRSPIYEWDAIENQ